jgi:hypothetical protein
MSKLIAFLLILCASMGALADETLFSDVHSGVYVAPQIGVGSLKGSLAAMAGGRIGWVANNAFVLGLAGNGLVTQNQVGSVGDTTSYAMIGYGGLFVEYMIGAERLIHPTVSLLIGGGMAGTQRRTPYEQNQFMYPDTLGMHTRFRQDASALFVVEPSASLEMNLASFLRVDLTASYRYVSNFTQPLYARSDVSGLTGNLGFKLGWF